MKTLPTIARPAFLVSVEVLDDRGLRVVLEERTGRGPLQDDPVGLGFKSREIVAQPMDATYEIRWPVVACFAVRGDPFPKGPPITDTVSEIGFDSAFLEWVKSNSHAGADYVAAMAGQDDAAGRALRHWVVSSNEAHFDVAALEPPAVNRLASFMS
jgi:hypothetical protein